MRQCLLFIVVLVLFTGCLSRYVVGEESRIQVKNQSEEICSGVALAGPENIRLITPEDFQLLPSEKSRVLTTSPLGIFEVHVFLETDTLKQRIELMGGSYQLEIKEGKLHFKE